VKTLYLALPAYNEERSLPALLARCIPVADALAAEGRQFKVIVVDDGSKDRTIEVARSFADRLSVEVVPHVVNQGLGAALRTCLRSGIERAQGEDVIATMDADNTHDPSLLPAMWHHLENTPGDIVIASRYCPGGDEVGLTPLRKVLSRGASFLLTMTVPVKGARDYTCGFRVYRSAMLRRAADQWGDKLIEESGFTCMAEVLLKLGRGGARVLEWPLILRYDLKEGASKMKIMRTIARYFGMAWRVRTGPAYRVV
jgi:dolichol-phosphate mannosyltransferase